MAKQEQDPNKSPHGFNIKIYLIAVLIGAALLGVALYIFVAARGTKDVPKANQPHPNARVAAGQSGRAA